MNIDVRIDGTFMSIASDKPIPLDIICDMTKAMTEMILDAIERQDEETKMAAEEKPF